MSALALLLPENRLRAATCGTLAMFHLLAIGDCQPAIGSEQNNQMLNIN